MLAAAVAMTGACGDDDGVGVVVDDDGDVGGGGGGGVVEGTPFLDEVYEFLVQKNVEFGSAGDPLTLDLYQPKGDPEGSRPAIVWVHGGGLTEGGKGQMTAFARGFAKRGYVSVTVSYRLADGDFDYRNLEDPVAEKARRDAQHDVQAAVRWLRANASMLRVDPDKIAVGGYSAGGTTALRVVFRPNDPGDSGNPGHSSAVAAGVIIAGSPLDITQSGSTLPLLFIHGDADKKAPFAASQAACAAMPGCKLVTVPKGDHALLGSSQDLIISETAEFLRARVLGR
jgi:dipeptidyl aminopeptidase/acylaminoacyl peptidase